MSRSSLALLAAAALASPAVAQ
jgi:predicted GH43/DUF377 family glycosyl hydrolase